MWRYVILSPNVKTGYYKVEFDVEYNGSSIFFFAESDIEFFAEYKKDVKIYLELKKNISKYNLLMRLWTILEHL